MRPRLLCLSIATLVLVLQLASPADAENGPRQRHPWGRFPVGAWKRVRIRKETYDLDGKLTISSIEESKTTLIRADEEHYTLELRTQIKAAGQEFTPPAKTVMLTYHGAAPAQQTEVKVLSEKTPLELEGQTLECQVHEVTIVSETARRVTKLYWHELHDGPLRLTTVAVRPQDGSTLQQTTSEVVARNLLLDVVGEQRSGTLVHTTLLRPDNAIRTHEFHCPQVPGGVVAAWSKQQDPGGRVQERSTLQLLDFGVPGTTGD